jgi:hypothetical protein
VDVFVGEADVSTLNLLLIWKKVLIGARGNFAPLLRCVVLVGENRRLRSAVSARGRRGLEIDEQPRSLQRPKLLLLRAPPFSALG